MGYNIAVAGKGGTGKTSLTGLLVNNLTKSLTSDFDGVWEALQWPQSNVSFTSLLK